VIRRLTLLLSVALLLVGGCGFWLFGPLADPPVAMAATPLGVPRVVDDPDAFIYIPASADTAQPLQVLVTMHGMGDNGRNFCQGMILVAERNGWIIVSPTFKYQDYKNADSTLQDDLTFLPKLTAILDSVPARIGLATRSKALLYGFSRGGQAVHRFATLYPERVAAVAVVSAGSYTLPLNSMLVNGRAQSLPMPYGVANMAALTGHGFDIATFQQIPFRISVGGADTNPNDTPRAWDAYVGTTRVERATKYTRILQDVGVNATLAVYPGVGHQVTPQMADENAAFLKGVLDNQAKRYGHAPASGVASFAAMVIASVQARR
jgi:pimeloyl-ACP methyl ester carboxylesterase